MNRELRGQLNEMMAEISESLRWSGIHTDWSIDIVQHGRAKSAVVVFVGDGLSTMTAEQRLRCAWTIAARYPRLLPRIDIIEMLTPAEYAGEVECEKGLPN
jgi:hypothetical protein